jgi:NTE family protein
MKRALILGEGGGTGVAWEIGVIKGLLDGGIDLNEADLIVGTSAGAKVGAQIRLGQDFNRLYREQFDVPSAKPAHLQNLDQAAFRELIKIMMVSRLTTKIRQRIGRLALNAKASLPEPFVESMIAALGSEWPDRLLMAVGVDVNDGTIMGFDKSSGVSLGRAVAISMCVPGIVAPISVNDRKYMDGATAGDNLNFASGYDRVIVIVTRDKAQSRAEVDTLRSSGSNVFYFPPDQVSAKAMGGSPLKRFDPAMRELSAESGLKQAAVMMDNFKRMWN